MRFLVPDKAESSSRQVKKLLTLDSRHSFDSTARYVSVATSGSSSTMASARPIPEVISTIADDSDGSVLGAARNLFQESSSDVSASTMDDRNFLTVEEDDPSTEMDDTDADDSADGVNFGSSEEESRDDE